MANAVIDASLAAAWCFPYELTYYTNEVSRAVGATADPIAPSLWAYEIHRVLSANLRKPVQIRISFLPAGDGPTFGRFSDAPQSPTC